jgi:hypothetical protein
MATTPIVKYSNNRLIPLNFPGVAKTLSVAIAASQNIPLGTVLGEVGNVNAVQSITLSCTGGTFTVTYGGKTTTAITASAVLPTAATLQAALVALTSIGANNVTVTGAAGGPYTVTLINALGAQPITLFTANGASLTGGAGTVVPALVTTGVVASGTYTPYADGNTDGSQIPKGLAEYDMQTDASGNITFSATANQSGGPFGETSLSAPVYVMGEFNAADLVGLDAAGLAAAFWRVLQGNVVSGIVLLP